MVPLPSDGSQDLSQSCYAMTVIGSILANCDNCQNSNPYIVMEDGSPFLQEEDSFCSNCCVYGPE